MPKQYVNTRLFVAIDRYKTANNLNTDYAFCQRFGINMQTFSGWKHGRSKSINAQTWSELRAHLEPYMQDDDTTALKERYLHRLDRILDSVLSTPAGIQGAEAIVTMAESIEGLSNSRGRHRPV